jgi:hypothetical protein
VGVFLRQGKKEKLVKQQITKEAFIFDTCRVFSSKSPLALNPSWSSQASSTTKK